MHLMHEYSDISTRTIQKNCKPNQIIEPNRNEVKIREPLCLTSEPNLFAQIVLEPNQMTI